MSFLILLGIIDIVVGAFLASSGAFQFKGFGLIFILAIISILKGLYSVLAGMGAGFYMDIMGWLDLVGGLMLLLAFWGIHFYFFFYFGIFLILKGLYSAMMGFVRV